MISYAVASYFVFLSCTFFLFCLHVNVSIVIRRDVTINVILKKRVT